MTLLFFPFLHPELVSHSIPAGVKFLDPGLKPSGPGEHYWRPSAFPLQPSEASRYIAQSLVFGEQFSSISELAYVSHSAPEDFYSKTSQALRSEFRRSFPEIDAKAEQQENNPFLQGQMMLLLLWCLEETLMDCKRLNDQFQNMGRLLHSSLGLSDIRPFAEYDLDLLENQDVDRVNLLQWTKILPWFLLCLGEGDGLFVLEPAILAEWKENGLTFNSESTVQGSRGDSQIELPQTMTMSRAEAQGWQLALCAKESQTRPWLNKHYTVFFAEASGEL